MSIPDSDSLRLDPTPSLDSAFYWKAAEEGRFVAQKCEGCSRLWHPPRPICPACHSKTKGEQELSGRGTVIGWAIPVRPAAVGFATPPIVALVEVEEGLRFLTNIEEVAPEKMKTGLQVKVDFAPTKGGKAVPIFRPVER